MTKLMLIGGFLGAGKTTLLNTLAAFFRKKGQKVGMVTNDQAPALVDTVYLTASSDLVEEVSGSCFCCNYNGFIYALEKLAQAGADMILAEPVGSCTDLSATILQPIKELQKDKLELMAFCVLVDPERLAALLDKVPTDMHLSALYIMRKQLEEADLIAISKADKYHQDFISSLIERAQNAFPGKRVLAISSLTGDGIEKFLETAASVQKPGSCLADIDYNIYAEGEAVLGWLNMETVLQSKGADWSLFANNLLSAIATQFEKEKIAIAHIKIYIQGAQGSVMGNIAGNHIAVRGTMPNQADVVMILNARAQTTPQFLLEQINTVLEKCCNANQITLNIKTVNCLMPGRPNPTHRYSEVLN